MWFPRPALFAAFFPDDVQFDFLYLGHPRAVTTFSWRRVPANEYRARFVHNTLLTACRDNISRLWSETSASEPLKFYVSAVSPQPPSETPPPRLTARQAIDPRNYAAFFESLDGDNRVTLHWLNTHELHQSLVQGHKTAADSELGAGGLLPSHHGGTPTKSPGAGASPQQGDRGSGRSAGLLDTRPESPQPPPCNGVPHSSLADFRSPLASAVQGIRGVTWERELWPDILFFVHPNGSIVFWSVSHLDEEPRRILTVHLVSWTVPGAIPAADAATALDDILVFPDSNGNALRRFFSAKEHTMRQRCGFECAAGPRPRSPPPSPLPLVPTPSAQVQSAAAAAARAADATQHGTADAVAGHLCRKERLLGGGSS